MGLLLFPSGATVSGPLRPTGSLRRSTTTTFRPSSSSGNVEATTDTTSTTASVAKNRQEWRAAGVGQAPFGLGLALSEEMRRDMMWRMLTFPAAAVAAEAVFLAVLNSGDGPAADAPAWAGKAGSAVLFAAGLLGSQYGFFSSRWDAAEEAGSAVGWELAVRHWNALSVARDSSVEEDDDDAEEEEDDDDEWEYYEDDEEEDDD